MKKLMRLNINEIVKPAGDKSPGVNINIDIKKENILTHFVSFKK